MEKVYLLLGSNMGDKGRNLSIAISLLITEMASFLGSDVTESSIYETEPWGFDSDETFLNQAIGFRTSLSPHDLLKTCKYVEVKMGREEKPPVYDNKGNRVYESRVIDIDILLFGDQTIDTPDLKIPHPELPNREFALIPLREILSNGSTGPPTV